MKQFIQNLEVNDPSGIVEHIYADGPNFTISLDSSQDGVFIEAQTRWEKMQSEHQIAIGTAVIRFETENDDVHNGTVFVNRVDWDLIEGVIASTPNEDTQKIYEKKA